MKVVGPLAGSFLQDARYAIRIQPAAVLREE
jgi:hypothetical protein